MIEGLKVGSIAYKQRWGEAAEPLKLIERSKILVENLQIRDVIKEQDDCARRAVRERLNALYSNHAERGLIRSGATLRDGIVVFEEEAASLIGNLVQEVLVLARNAGAFALVMEGVEQFLALLDGELGRIVKKVEYENQDSGSSRGIARATEKLWAEKRARLLERLERHRWEFLMPAQEPPAADLLPDDEPDGAPAVAGVDREQPVREPGDEPPTAAEAADLPADVEDDLPVAAKDDELPVAEQSNDAEVAGPDADRAPLADHWHEMWSDLALQLWAGKLRPKTQEDLGRAMADWFDGQDIRPAEREVGDCARRLWTKYAATHRITSSIKDQPQDLASARFDWLPDRPESGSYRVSSQADIAGAEATRLEPMPVVSPGMGRSIDLTAPALAFD